MLPIEVKSQLRKQRVTLWHALVVLLVLAIFGFAPGNHGPARFASAATQPPISGLETLRQGVPLQKDNPAASIDAFLRSAAGGKPDRPLHKRVAVFRKVLEKHQPQTEPGRPKA